MDVAVVRWPEQEALRTALAAGARPRLLVVTEVSPLPPVIDCLEDWVVEGQPAEEVEARAGALLARAAMHGAATPPLLVDGLLSYRGARITLPPIDARITEVLLAARGRVVSADRLARAAWGTPRERNALDVRLLRLRRRLQPVGIAVRTVRSRGYVLDVSDACQVAAGPAVVDASILPGVMKT